MLTLLTTLAGWLPPGLRRHATPERLQSLAQLGAFACAGLFGLALDIATVYALRESLGLYAAGIVAYLVSATGNWAVNRNWTFRSAQAAPARAQWVRFLIGGLAGMAVNRGVYAVLVTVSPLCATHPVLAIAAGTAAGMGVNFHMARRYIFRDHDA